MDKRPLFYNQEQPPFELHCPSLEELDGYQGKCERDRLRFLEFVREVYNPGKIFYPGPGSDSIVERVFGKERVSYLSLEEHDTDYLSFLGASDKVRGDFRRCPFANGVFDAIFIHASPAQATTEALDEFRRVLKSNGILLLEGYPWFQEELDIFLRKASEIFEKQPLPLEFDNPKERIIFIAVHNDESSIGPIKYVATSEEEYQRISQIVPTSKQTVTREYFALFRKKG